MNSNNINNNIPQVSVFFLLLLVHSKTYQKRSYFCLLSRNRFLNYCKPTVFLPKHKYLKVIKYCHFQVLQVFLMHLVFHNHNSSSKSHSNCSFPRMKPLVLEIIQRAGVVSSPRKDSSWGQTRRINPANLP